MMAAWFRFKDVLSTDLGVHVTEYPPATIPEERVTFKPVPGRSGNLTLLEGDVVYEDITLSIGCYAPNLSRLDEIATWLRGRGDLVLGNDPDRCYRARIVNQIELTQVMRGKPVRNFDAIFRCQPFKYEANPEPYRFTRPITIPGEGTIPAAPLITIQGVGNITLTVGKCSIAIDGLSGSVTIDCEAMTAYHTGDPEARMAITLLDKDWPELSTESTSITWTGDVRLMTVETRWRWI